MSKADFIAIMAVYSMVIGVIGFTLGVIVAEKVNKELKKELKE